MSSKLPGRRDPQLLKGVLPMLILAILSRKESYGYELVVQLENEGLTDIATGTVYPLLTRLEREGLLTFRLVASASGPARKYYSPTDLGLEHLSEAISAWSALHLVVRTITTALPEDARKGH